MADALGITTVTLWNWANKHPELGDAIAEGKVEQFDPKVERSLAERALGYYVDVDELKVINDEPVIVTVRKYYPPDVTACIYWTKNRMPDRWRDVQRHVVDVGQLKTPEELRELLAAEFKDLIDQGVLKLPAPDRRKMKEINPKSNGQGDT